MASEKLNYASVIADVEAKIAAWQAVLASLIGALALAQGADPPDLSSVAATSAGDVGQPLDLPKDAFHGKSLPACVELYLSATPMKKRTNKEIAAALREGGVESNAKHFDTVVTGTLFGLKKAGKVLRFKDGWGLASWYPAHIRAAIPAKSTKSAKRAKKGGWKKRLHAKIDAKLEEMETADDAQPVRKKANERILEQLRSKPHQSFPLSEIAEHVGMGAKGARLILGKLVKQGKARMTAPGMYTVEPFRLAAGS